MLYYESRKIITNRFFLIIYFRDFNRKRPRSPIDKLLILQKIELKKNQTKKH